MFASWTQILRPKHMFFSLATPGNITRNIVSAKMFPSLARPFIMEFYEEQFKEQNELIFFLHVFKTFLFLTF